MQSLSQSPTEPGFIQDPYPFYDRARALGDLFWWDEYKMACAVSHPAVSTILRDRRLGREIPPESARPIPAHLEPFYAIEAHSMLELEPPRHTRLRGLVLRAFTSRRIAAFGPEARALAHGLIDDFPDRPFDLLAAFARPIPVIIVARLLGVPEQRADDLLTWSNDMVAMYQARRTPEIEARAVASTLAFRTFITSHIDARRRAPADDLISQLITAEQSDGRLSTDEMIATCMLLLNAGHEATVHTIGNAVRMMLERDIRQIDEDGVEELIRLDPPLHMFTRWVYEDVTLFGQDFKRGDQIACLLAAANRDPNTFADPNDYKPLRDGPANTSFGGGIHFCVGAPLARLELVNALQALLERCPRLRLAEAPRFANVYHFHGLERLMVTKA